MWARSLQMLISLIKIVMDSPLSPQQKKLKSSKYGDSLTLEIEKYIYSNNLIYAYANTLYDQGHNLSDTRV